MQYSPKLKNAIAEINEILNKYDIGALIVLHTPGHSEYLLKIDPSYSCAKFEGENIRIKAKIQEDFNGDKKAWEQKLQDTSNLMNLLGTTSANITMNVIAISEKLDKIVNAEHTSGDHTSHTTQNN